MTDQSQSPPGSDTALDSKKAPSKVAPKAPKAFYRFTVLRGIHAGASTVCPEAFTLGSKETNEIELKDQYFSDASINISIENLDGEGKYQFSVDKDNRAVTFSYGISESRLYLLFDDVALVLSKKDDEIESNSIPDIAFTKTTLEPGSAQPRTADSVVSIEKAEPEKRQEQELKGKEAPQKDLDENLDIDEFYPEDFEDNIDWEATEVLRVSWFRRVSAFTIVIIATGFIWYLSKLMSTEDTMPVAEVDIKKLCTSKINNRIHSVLGYNLAIKPLKKGNDTFFYKVSGIVDSANIKKKLTQKINLDSCKIAFDLIFLDDEVAEIIQFIDAKHDQRVELIRDPKQGRVIMTGFVPKPDKWSYTLKIVDSMLDNRIGILDKVKFTDDVEAFLLKTLDQFDLSGYVILSKDQDYQLVANMIFQPDLLRQWDLLHGYYQSIFEYAPTIKVEEINLGQLGIRAVAIGEQPRVVLSNGQTYLIGSIFPNGAVLTKIEKDSVTLETPKGKVKYPVFQKAMASTIKGIAERNGLKGINDIDLRSSKGAVKSKRSKQKLLTHREYEQQEKLDQTLFTSPNENDTQPTSLVPSMKIITDYFIDKSK